MNCIHPFFIYLLLHGATTIASQENSTMRTEFIGRIGAIVDYSTRAGKEEKIALEIAVEDFFRATNSKPILHIRHSSGKPLQTVSKVVELINKDQVQAIVGSLTWREAALAEEMNNRSIKVPTISYAGPTVSPPLASVRWPFLLHMSSDISIEMQCIASIVSSYRWRRVVAIYEDKVDSEDAGIITSLSDALRGVGSEIQQYSTLPPFTSLPNPKTAIQEELKRLKNGQCRVFVILQSSMPLAGLLFSEARKMGMMEKGYVWITTNTIADFLHSIDFSVIPSMQGLIGIKTYFSDSNLSFQDFRKRFRQRFRLEYPEEENPSPGISALRAYDAVWAISYALINSKLNSSERLLERIRSGGINGMSGEIQFKDGELANTPIFQIVNVIGKSYREIGIWSPLLGFSKSVTGKGGGGGSMDGLGPVFWPGGLQVVPRGRAAMSDSLGNEKKLRIGVPARSAFYQFVNVRNNGNPKKAYVTGFSVRVFEAVVKRLPYNMPYELIPYNGSYDELLQQVYLKNFDGAIGDIEIMADRCQYADFSQPYIEAGLTMVVKERRDKIRKAWILLKPFTESMWALICAMDLFVGTVVWLIERKGNEDFGGGTFGDQIGTMLWFSASAIFFAHREQLRSNLSRLVVLTWLFVALILTSSYTANLSSILTVPELEPSVVDIAFLKQTQAAVGCNGNSFIVSYLVDVLGFSPRNIKRIASIDDYPAALSNGDIAAAFFVEPHARVFLAKYCNGYTIVGPSYKLGGFGFAFPKGSPLVVDISKAILQVMESGEMHELEKGLLSFSQCSSSTTGDTNRLGVEAFWGLTLILASVCLGALVFYLGSKLLPYLKRWRSMINRHVVPIPAEIDHAGYANPAERQE